jgi:hypothetical protein
MVGRPGVFTLCGAVTLLDDELAIPAKNRVGFDDHGHCLPGLLPQLLADGGQRRAFAIRHPHTACDRVAQDTMFRHQVRGA